MLLAVDIGNTNIVLGTSNKKGWGKVWRIQTDSGKTADEYEALFRSLFSNEGICKNNIDKVIISSVVPSLTGSFQEMVRNLFSLEALIVGPNIFAILPIKIVNPYEIGTDLVANAVAAFNMHQAPCMIIDFGTALTFTTIGSEGNILGVAIAPGLRTAVKSLAGNTAQLPHVQLVSPPSVLGKNTVHAIQSGIVHGYCGLVNHMIVKTEEETKLRLKIIATGGLASVIAPQTKSIHSIEENLTLDGLKIIADLIS